MIRKIIELLEISYDDSNGVKLLKVAVKAYIIATIILLTIAVPIGIATGHAGTALLVVHIMSVCVGIVTMWVYWIENIL